MICTEMGIALGLWTTMWGILCSVLEFLHSAQCHRCFQKKKALFTACVCHWATLAPWWMRDNFNVCLLEDESSCNYFYPRLQLFSYRPSAWRLPGNRSRGKVVSLHLEWKLNSGPEMSSEDLTVAGVPVSISSCAHVFSSSALLLFCRVVEKERPVGRPAGSTAHRRSGSLLICP